MDKKKLAILLGVVFVLFSFFIFKSKRNGDIYISDQVMDVNQIFNLKVLQIAFNPTEGNRNLADMYFPNPNGFLARQIEDNIVNDNIQAFRRLSNNTINYSVVKKIDITTFPNYSNGFKYDFESYAKCSQGDPGGVCERQKQLFDHVRWIQENGICQIAEENNIDEIWLVTNDFLTTWENFMIGPTNGFGVNGGSYLVPECKKHYVVVSPTYKQYENFLHNYGHRIEATMRYVTSNWKSEDIKKYWDNFAYINRTYGQGAYDMKDLSLKNEVFCGNAHFPSNADSHYDCSSMAYGKSNCEDWLNFPDFKGASKNINCSTWGCVDEGWQEYWFSYIPRSSGEILMQSIKGKNFYLKKNWWNYLLYPDKAIEFVNQTYNGVIIKTTPTPTPKPTQKPSPTSTPIFSPTVTPTPNNKIIYDLDKDKDVDIFDFRLFRQDLLSNNLRSDFDNNGKVDIFDFRLFRESFLDN